jgi:hypothetical protein
MSIRSCVIGCAYIFTCKSIYSYLDGGTDARVVNLSSNTSHPSSGHDVLPYAHMSGIIRPHDRVHIKYVCMRSDRGMKPYIGAHVMV